MAAVLVTTSVGVTGGSAQTELGVIDRAMAPAAIETHRRDVRNRAVDDLDSDGMQPCVGRVEFIIQ